MLSEFSASVRLPSTFTVPCYQQMTHTINREYVKINNVFYIAKFEENNATIPKMSELNAVTNNRYSITDYKCLEVIILKFFDWYIMFPTPAHYTHYYIQGMICPQDYNNTQVQEGIRTLFFNLHDCITEYLDQIIDSK